MKAIFRYPGSKWSIADWIIAHFPEGYEKNEEEFTALDVFCDVNIVLQKTA